MQTLEKTLNPYSKTHNEGNKNYTQKPDTLLHHTKTLYPDVPWRTLNIGKGNPRTEPGSMSYTELSTELDFKNCFEGSLSELDCKSSSRLL